MIGLPAIACRTSRSGVRHLEAGDHQRRDSSGPRPAFRTTRRQATDRAQVEWPRHYACGIRDRRRTLSQLGLNPPVNSIQLVLIDLFMARTIIGWE